MRGSLMVQGATSDAGKSVLVAGLCRILFRQGIAVAPFKPQNMSLNSAVTADGGEIGRAQALQARAAGLPPSVHMNPVLLKPSSDTHAQVILQGRALNHMGARDFHDYKKLAMYTVLDSWRVLKQRHSMLIVEGAGSPAEINLREGDIANMGFAEEVDCPVIIVADIDRGGVFAHLVGTLALLSRSEQARVAGFVINRFRGDLALLQPGIEWLKKRTGKPVFGVIPYLQDLRLDAEDAIELSELNASKELGEAGKPREEPSRCTLVVPLFSRIANHTDFDPLRHHPDITLVYATPGQPLPPADLIILPGSKNVRADLQMLRDQGWDNDIMRHLRFGGRLLGVCGGYQMLGTEIRDPLGIEDVPGATAGLGLLPMDTELHAQKQLRQVHGVLAGGAAVSGYEIHCGETRLDPTATPFLTLVDGRKEGVLSPDEQVAGTYLHGIFDRPEACAAILAWAGLKLTRHVDIAQQREAELDRLADCIERHMDLTQLWKAIGVMP